MSARTKRLVVAAICLMLLGCIAAGWATFTVFAWARELPSRIRVNIDEEAFATAVGAAMVESYHHVLRDGDAASQVDVLRKQLIPHAKADADAAVWIRDEYGDDIRGLVSSSDPVVSAAATELLEVLNAEAGTASRQNGG